MLWMTITNKLGVISWSKKVQIYDISSYNLEGVITMITCENLGMELEIKYMVMVE